MVQWEQVIKIICNDPNWPSHRMILYQSCLRMLMILLSNWPTYPSPGGDQWRYTTEGTSNLKQATALNHGTSTASEDIWSITASLTSHSHHIHITFTSHSPSFSDVLPDVLPSFSKVQLVVNHPWQKLPMTVGSRAGWVNLARVVGFLVNLAPWFGRWCARSFSYFVVIFKEKTSLHYLAFHRKT